MTAVRKAIRTSTAAKMLGLTPKTIRQYLASGRLEGFQIPGGPHRVYEDSVLAMMKDHAPPDLDSAPY
jgi:excisionase family DNA binding protein